MSDIDAAIDYYAPSAPSDDHKDKALQAARSFLEEFDRYFGNGGAGPAHPKFFDCAYYELRAQLGRAGIRVPRNATHPLRAKAEANAKTTSVK